MPSRVRVFTSKCRRFRKASLALGRSRDRVYVYYAYKCCTTLRFTYLNPAGKAFKSVPTTLLYISHTQSSPKKLKLCHCATTPITMPLHYASAYSTHTRPTKFTLHYSLYVLEKGKLMHLFFHLLCRRMARNSNWAAIIDPFQMATQRSAKLKQFRSLPCCVPGDLWSQ